MRRSVFLISLLSLWAIVSLADPKPVADAAHIVRAGVDKEGSLEIDYSDGSHDTIPKDKRGSYDDKYPIKQDEVFSDIQISGDKTLVGWTPQYMICPQSYPCTPEVVIYRRGKWPKFISPPYGLVWSWAFTPGYDGSIVVHYGFPHGVPHDAYGLFDLASGQQDSEYPKDYAGKAVPDWAAPLVALDAKH